MIQVLNRKCVWIIITLYTLVQKNWNEKGEATKIFNLKQKISTKICIQCNEIRNYIFVKMILKRSKKKVNVFLLLLHQQWSTKFNFNLKKFTHAQNLLCFWSIFMNHAKWNKHVGCCEITLRDVLLPFQCLESDWNLNHHHQLSQWCCLSSEITLRDVLPPF